MESSKRDAEMKIEGIDHVALTVNDVELSIEWYQKTLGLERRYQKAWGNRPAMLCAGTTCLALFAADSRRPKPVPDHNTVAMRHLAFRVNREDFEKAQQDLTEAAIKFRFEDHGISHSIYFQDPDGHNLEITAYDL